MSTEEFVQKFVMVAAMSRDKIKLIAEHDGISDGRVDSYLKKAVAAGLVVREVGKDQERWYRLAPLPKS